METTGFRGEGSSVSEREEKESDVRPNKQNLNKTETIAVPKTNCNTTPTLASQRKPSTTYVLEHFDKNLLIMFNQYKIIGYKPRKGTMEDADLLESTFGKFGFECERHDEYTRKKILNKLDYYSKKDFTDYGCVVVAVMTHGTYDGGIMAQDVEYNELDILRRLRNSNTPSLNVKPLILLIAACRGFDDTEGVAVNKPEVPKKKAPVKIIHYLLPLASDTLVFHSGYIGKASYRLENGTWFIQTLCKKINEMSDKNDLSSIMTEVKREVACDFVRIEVLENKENPLKEYHKQMPTTTSTLTRKLYFKRKSGNTTNTTDLLRSGVSRQRISSDTVDTVPSFPAAYSFYLKKQSDSCLCHVDHLRYMEDCLSLFTEDNPKDLLAQYLRNSMPNQIDSKTESARTRLATISNYLIDKLMHSDHRKYVYFYEAVVSDGNCSKNIILYRNFLPKWDNIKTYMPGVFLGISTYLASRLVYHLIYKK